MWKMAIKRCWCLHWLTQLKGITDIWYAQISKILVRYWSVCRRRSIHNVNVMVLLFKFFLFISGSCARVISIFWKGNRIKDLAWTAGYSCSAVLISIYLCIIDGCCWQGKPSMIRHGSGRVVILAVAVYVVTYLHLLINNWCIFNKCWWIWVNFIV